ncbi:vpu protein [Simian immunodeficiency virus]|uniref:Vpu protein n=1 Tax=Simian immunodeficiency virus TaxID=11723 RepID=A4UDF9_SIV|nr:vpu protein [Simian immunodeficiency virus]
MHYWYLGAAIVTAIYLVIALVAFILAYQRWCQPKPPIEVNVLRLLEEGDSDSGIFEDACDGEDEDSHRAFANPSFEP